MLFTDDVILAFCCAVVFPFDVIDLSVSEFVFVGTGQPYLSTTAIFSGLGFDIAARSVFVLSAQGTVFPLGPHPVALKIFISLFGSRSAAQASGLGSSIDFPRWISAPGPSLAQRKWPDHTGPPTFWGLQVL
jgi:hypothetical protein